MFYVFCFILCVLKTSFLFKIPCICCSVYHACVKEYIGCGFFFLIIFFTYLILYRMCVAIFHFVHLICCNLLILFNCKNKFILLLTKGLHRGLSTAVDIEWHIEQTNCQIIAIESNFNSNCKRFYWIFCNKHLSK